MKYCHNIHIYILYIIYIHIYIYIYINIYICTYIKTFFETSNIFWFLPNLRSLNKIMKSVKNINLKTN